MRKWMTLIAAGAFLAGPAPGGVWAAEPIALDDAPARKPPQEVDALCHKLKLTGTAADVPALAPYLTDETLWESARYALESIPGPEAAAALRQAAGEAGGKIKAGLLDSLGRRRDRPAVGLLAGLLGDADAMVASSAAGALGRIGGREAVGALDRARAKADAALRGVIDDALLRCAEGLLASGEKKAAAEVYRKLRADGQAGEQVRTAAFRGMVLAAEAGGADLVVRALTGDDRPALLAALKLVTRIDGEAATKAFAGAVAKVAGRTQVALIAALAERGDPAAAPAVLAACAGDDPAAREAAYRALAVLGNGSAVAALAAGAAGAEGEPAQRAAAWALARLRGPGARQAILDHLAKADGPIRLQLIRALGERGQPESIAPLLKLAGGADEAVAVASVRALAAIADDGAAAGLAGLIVRTAGDTLRNEAEKALTSICTRTARKQQCAEPIVAALAGAAPTARCALLRACGALGGPTALKVLRSAVKDADATVREAAVRGLASCPDVEAAADLAALAGASDDLTLQVVALRGCVRLLDIATDADLAAEKKLAVLRAALAATRRPEEKKLVLAGLARLPLPGALALVEPLLSDKPVQREAVAACWQIARAVASSHPQQALAACRKLLEVAADRRIRSQAADLVRRLDRPTPGQ